MKAGFDEVLRNIHAEVGEFVYFKKNVNPVARPQGYREQMPPLFAKLVLGIFKTDEKIGGAGAVANLQRSRGSCQHISFVPPYPAYRYSAGSTMTTEKKFSEVPHLYKHFYFLLLLLSFCPLVPHDAYIYHPKHKSY